MAGMKNGQLPAGAGGGSPIAQIMANASGGANPSLSDFLRAHQAAMASGAAAPRTRPAWPTAPADDTDAPALPVSAMPVLAARLGAGRPSATQAFPFGRPGY